MIKLLAKYALLIGITTLLLQCKKTVGDAQFTALDHKETGVDFRNLLRETEQFNIFKYQYFYNGGGVSIADFDNDGLQDLFFAGNMVKNRLYKNKGDMEFEDITESSGVAKNEGWCTGTNAVDINNDGYMDLYVCRAGYPFTKLRSNLLLINNKNMTFTDRAAEYGLADTAYSTHSAFLDYDRDGDLDMFLLNHSAPQYSKGGLDIFTLKNKREIDLESKLYRNDGGKFTNVSEEAGIRGNVLSLSLGLGVIDINNDGWTDIFIGNDFNESDYLFLNNGDGTFTEKSKEVFDHTSMFSMGCDIADINNDSHLDLVSLDMLPEGNYLQKKHSGADNYSKISAMIKSGFQPQFSKNVLQINNGDGTFSESAQMYGVSNTDWSWASLFLDFDYDGYQDLFITNGYLRDHTDMDFLQFTADEVIKANRGENPVSFEEYLASMPPIRQPNYFFSNVKGKKFVDMTKQWKLATPTVSHGAAYGDLDNDGDLDLVTSNVGEYALIYQNNNNHSHQYINIKLKGQPQNIHGIGSKIFIYAQGQKMVTDLQPCRGFQSTMQNEIYFGLGKIQRVDSVVVVWPTGVKQIYVSPALNKKNVFTYDANQCKPYLPHVTPNQMLERAEVGIDHPYTADQFDDLKIQGLLPFFLTDRGPKSVVKDLNGDGLEDVVITGNAIDPTMVYFQNRNGNFSKKRLPLPLMEVSDICTISAPNSSVDDIAIACGSYKYDKNEKTRGIYILKNDGKGNFSQSQFIHTPEINPSAIASITADKVQHLLIGGHCFFGEYPISSSSLLLINSGNNTFDMQRSHRFDAGMVNDIEVADIDHNGQQEIIIAGDFTQLYIYTYQKGKLNDVTSSYIDTTWYGLWKKVFATDLDGDGKLELVVGNLGLNSQLKAEPGKEMEVHKMDYDQNGSIDPIFAHFIIDDIYPFAPREDMIKQIPLLSKRFTTFSQYAESNIKEVLGESFYKKSVPLKVNTLESSIFEWKGGKLHRKALPMEAQVAPIFAIGRLSSKTQDGLCLAGNQTRVRVKLGQLSGNHGQIFTYQNQNLVLHSQLQLSRDVRDLARVKTAEGDVIIFSEFGGRSSTYKLRKI